MDGLGDLPNKSLNGKTPLEVAKTPNMDFFAARGKQGWMIPVKPGFVPESDEAIVSIFGNKQIASTRGQLEASGAGIKTKRGDLALRVNFATIDSIEEGNIVDRRVGRTLTTKEAKILERDLNKSVKMPFEFEFKSTVQHRGALVFKGGFSDNITGNDVTYEKGKSHNIDKISYCKPQDDDENSQYSANVVNEFLEKAFEILDKHPINKSRKKKGMMPANYLLVRGAGVEVPKLKKYSKWMSVSYMPLEVGFSKLCGMRVFDFPYPVLKEMDSYKNLYKGLNKACKFSIKTLKKNHKKFSYAYVHLKETDVPGHDNKPHEKVKMIEYIDKTLFKFLRNFCPLRNIRLVVTADHSTPCKLKDHSADPVPVLHYPAETGVKPETDKHFSEKESRVGSLGKINGKDFIKKIGFNR